MSYCRDIDTYQIGVAQQGLGVLNVALDGPNTESVEVELLHEIDVFVADEIGLVADIGEVRGCRLVH